MTTFEPTAGGAAEPQSPRFVSVAPEPAVPSATAAVGVAVEPPPGNAKDVAAASSERDLLELYFGPRAATYLATYDQLVANPRRLRGQWSWPAFLVSLPWLLYRKLWSAAAAVLVLPIALSYVIPSTHIFGTLVALSVAQYGRAYYVRSAIKQVRHINATTSDPAVVRDKVTRAGGVSVVGAILGGAVMFALLVLVVCGEIAKRKASG